MRRGLRAQASSAHRGGSSRVVGQVWGDGHAARGRNRLRAAGVPPTPETGGWTGCPGWGRLMPARGELVSGVAAKGRGRRSPRSWARTTSIPDRMNRTRFFIPVTITFFSRANAAALQSARCRCCPRAPPGRPGRYTARRSACTAASRSARSQDDAIGLAIRCSREATRTKRAAWASGGIGFKSGAGFGGGGAIPSTTGFLYRGFGLGMAPVARKPRAARDKPLISSLSSSFPGKLHNS